MSHLLADNRFEAASTPAAEVDVFAEAIAETERLGAGCGPVREIPVTDEMRQRDAEERAARGQRKPPAHAKRLTERELDKLYAGMDRQEKYWLFEAATSWFAHERKTA